MLILFLRHGEAEKNTTIDDEQRQLTQKGIEDARKVGKFMKAHSLLPELILTSPLLRSQQTANEIASITNIPVETTKYLLSDYLHSNIIDFLNSLDRDSVLLIGHLPLIASKLLSLIADTTNGSIEMKPCSLAALTISRPVKTGKGTLLFLLPPELME